MKRFDIIDSPEKKFVSFCFLMAICLNIGFSSLGFSNSLLEHNGQSIFRQTQTAISSWYYLKEGFALNYITPVFGAPWSIPLEFPTYQFIVAAISRLTSIPFESAGRLISLVFFYLTLCYIYRILSLYYDRVLSLIPIILLLVCSQYIYWSRTFMIESTALFFCISHFYYLLKLKQVFCYRTLVYCLLLGILGSLTKITTYVVVMMPAGLYFLGCMVTDLLSRKMNTIKWTVLVSPVFMSFAAAVLWAVYADHLRGLNPLASDLIAHQDEWLFGTLQQRLGLTNWNRIASLTIYGMCSLYVCLLIPLLGTWTSKPDRLFIGLSLSGFLSGPLVFFNLYLIHYYYHYSNIFFLVIAIGVTITAVAGKPELSPILRKAAVWVAMPIVASVMFSAYINSEYFKAQKSPFALSPQILCLRNNFKDTDILLIYDNDWSSMLPYYLERKSVMNPKNYPLDHPLMVSSLNLTGKDKIVAIIKYDGLVKSRFSTILTTVTY